MCVSQFRDYVQAMPIVRDGGDNSFDNDADRVSVDATRPHLIQSNGVSDLYYVRTDRRKMKRLADLGNPYAKQYLTDNPK